MWSHSPVGSFLTKITLRPSREKSPIVAGTRSGPNGRSACVTVANGQELQQRAPGAAALVEVVVEDHAGRADLRTVALPLDAEEREAAVAQAQHVDAVRGREDGQPAGDVHRGRGWPAAATRGGRLRFGRRRRPADRGDRGFCSPRPGRRGAGRRSAARLGGVAAGAARAAARRRSAAAAGRQTIVPLAASDPGMDRHAPAAERVGIDAAADAEAARPRKVGMADVGEAGGCEDQGDCADDP